MDSVSEARLQLVNPILAGKIRKMAEMLEGEKIVFRVTQGMRTWADQDRLYQQGRTTDGNVVTNAPPGHSWHNFGLAVDLDPDLTGTMDDGFQPDWDLSHPSWQRMVDVGSSLGLTNGKSWKDEPHFQLTGRFSVSPDDEVRQLFKDGGVQAVWDESGVS